MDGQIELNSLDPLAELGFWKRRWNYSMAED